MICLPRLYIYGALGAKCTSCGHSAAPSRLGDAGRWCSKRAWAPAAFASRRGCFSVEFLRIQLGCGCHTDQPHDSPVPHALLATPALWQFFPRRNAWRNRPTSSTPPRTVARPPRSTALYGMYRAPSTERFGLATGGRPGQSEQLASAPLPCSWGLADAAARCRGRSATRYPLR